jgi:hypothetical protein
MDRIKRAHVLRIGLEASGARLAFPYEIDNEFRGSLQVTYPFPLGRRNSALLSPIGVGIAAFTAQLCLAEQVILDFPCTQEMVDAMLPILQMLYDIRCWRDQQELMAPPAMTRAAGSCALVPFKAPDRKRATLLWSGGKDSTLAAILLRQNGYSVDPVHIPMNARAEQNEMGAVAALAPLLHLSPHTIRFEMPEFLKVAKRYAILWDIFPGYNIVPFGRDLVLALLATPIARRADATYLCLGHEHGSRTNYFEYRGKRVARDDVESIAGGQLLEAYLQSFISPTLKFLPPVAGLPEFRVLHELFTKYPEVMPHISYCFWGAACGRCSKCLRYYLAGRVYGKESLLQMQANPLYGDNCLDLSLCFQNWGTEEGRSYSDMVMYCLALLTERGDVRPGEALVERFAAEIYPHIRLRIGAMGEQLMAVFPDPQVPPDFRID